LLEGGGMITASVVLLELVEFVPGLGVILVILLYFIGGLPVYYY
jgi:hypothetical protein